jgi:hypothetical protein
MTDATGSAAETPASAPLFSVIVLFYNQPHFVGPALDSVLAGRCDSAEIIAVDNGSADETRQRILEYSGSVRTVLIDDNEGGSVGRNKAAGVARGDYLVFLDGDDLFLPWTLDVYETVVTARRPVAMVAPMQWFEGATPSPGPAPAEASYVEYEDYFRKEQAAELSASAMVIEREAFERVGGWEFHPVEDQDLLWKLGTAGRFVQIVDPVTTFHRAHPGQTSRGDSAMRDTISALAQNERDGRYPGGKARRFERRACVGGVVFHWTRRTWRKGEHAEAWRFLRANWAFVAAATAMRVRVVGKGRREPQTIAMSNPAPRAASRAPGS